MCIAMHLSCSCHAVSENQKLAKDYCIHAAKLETEAVDGTSLGLGGGGGTHCQQYRVVISANRNSQLRREGVLK